MTESPLLIVQHEDGCPPAWFGEWFTAADVMSASMLIWHRIFTGKPDRPRLDAYADRLLARPKAMKFGS